MMMILISTAARFVCVTSDSNYKRTLPVRFTFRVRE